ncbi:hypothetical protein FOMPIDRAFT_1083749, partial [Fomitopsis schrenkii]
RFRRLGARADLELAVVSWQRALVHWPLGHHRHSHIVSNLAIALCTRFEQFGDRADLDSAITLHREALELCPPGHPDRSASLNNLAGAL